MRPVPAPVLNRIAPWPDEEAVDRHRRRLKLAPPAISRYQAALAAWGVDIPTTGEL